MIAVLVGINLAVHLGGVDSMLIAPGAAVVLLVFARLSGLSWSELGLGRSRLPAGAAWGLAAVAIIATVYTVGVLWPLTRDTFEDSRYHHGAGAAFYTALVHIPLSTVIFEEIAFRGVLMAQLVRVAGRWWALGVTSVLFGLWHALAGSDLQSANAGIHDALGSRAWLAVLGTVAFTGLSGVVLGYLRLRSGSLLASLGLHWATNGLGVLFGVWAWNLA